MTGKWVQSRCPHCGTKMAIALKGGRIQLLCRGCDSDPLKPPKIYRIIDAARRRKDDHEASSPAEA